MKRCLRRCDWDFWIVLAVLVGVVVLCALVNMLAGCVQPGGVAVQAEALGKMENQLADLSRQIATVQAAGPVSQPAGDVAGDNRPIGISGTVAGSGWPMAAAFGLLAFAALAAFALWLRSRDRLDVSEANGRAVQDAIAEMPAGPQRDGLLRRVETRLEFGRQTDRGRWDRDLKRRGRYIRRQHRESDG